MKKIFPIYFFISVMCGFAFAQSTLPTLEKIKQLKLLESTREDAIKLLNNEDVGYYDSQDFDISDFYSEDANVRVFYSSGNCSDEDEDWNAPEDIVTGIYFSPKEFVELKDLGIDYSKFRKERPYRDYKNKFVYYDKKAGIAIMTVGDSVHTVSFSPSEKDFSQLCNKPEVKNYYSSKRWLRDPETKNAAIDDFPPPDVTALDLSRNEITICDLPDKNCAENKISVSTTIKNYMGDVVLYDYRITGGKIIGRGEKVIWDLSEAKAGTYKITAIASNGSGPEGKWITKTIIIKE